MVETVADVSRAAAVPPPAGQARWMRLARRLDPPPPTPDNTAAGRPGGRAEGRAIVVGRRLSVPADIADTQTD